MRVVWMLGLLAGCYGPSFAPGAPCDPAIDNCPAGQTCQLDGFDHRCLPPGTAIDAPEPDAVDASFVDPDGDGIDSATDNCPALANPSQHDEDTDMVGDVCDPCPVSGNNVDGDGDGIGNDCDPRPNMPGDTLVVFESFETALPATWSATSSGGGVWTVANDELRIVTTSGVTSSTRTNIPATARMMAVTSVVVDQMFGAGTSVGVAVPYATNVGGSGVLCSLYQASVGSRFLSLSEIAPATAIDNDPLAWVDGAPYILANVKIDTNYSCSQIGGITAQGASSTVVTAPTIGVRSEGASARFQWLMIIKIP